jgi:hypothetical protein
MVEVGHPLLKSARNLRTFLTPIIHPTKRCAYLECPKFARIMLSRYISVILSVFPVPLCAAKIMHILMMTCTRHMKGDMGL